jgi:hypothetical protein
MLTEVQTPWLDRHDADDIALPNRIALIRDAIAKHPDAGLFYTLASYLQNGRQYGSFRTTIASPQAIRNLSRAGYLLSMAHPTAILNVAKVQQAGGYRFNLHIEDIDLWWRMALQWDIRLIPQKTIGVTLNLKSVSSANLEKQSINCLYVQYLLLSHLWGLRPISYESIAPWLAKLVDRKHLQFREHLRYSQMALGGGQYSKCLFHALQAAYKSPSGLVRRIAYEFTKGAGINVSGIDPREFAARSDQLWPNEHPNSCRNVGAQRVPQSATSDKSVSLTTGELAQSSIH